MKIKVANANHIYPPILPEGLYTWYIPWSLPGNSSILDQKLWALIYILKDADLIKYAKDMLHCKFLQEVGVDFTYEIIYKNCKNNHVYMEYFTPQIDVSVEKHTRDEPLPHYILTLTNQSEEKFLLLVPEEKKEYITLQEKLSFLLYSNIPEEVKDQYRLEVHSQGKEIYYKTQKSVIFNLDNPEALRGYSACILNDLYKIEVIEK